MGLSRGLYFLLALLVGAIAFFPLISISGGSFPKLFDARSVAAFNLIGWSLVVLFMFERFFLRRSLVEKALKFGLHPSLKSVDEIIHDLLVEISRKNESLSINLVEQRINSPEDLSSALERIVSKGYRFLDAQSAELALFDKETGLYHSALLVGMPTRATAQAMLDDASRGALDSPTFPDVLVQPVAFAGTLLGTLRICLKNGRLPKESDREIVKLLALQAGLAVMNAEYTAQLLRMSRTSEETIRARTGFLANLSHEIRGPLGIMLNAVELVLDGICGDITKEQAKTLNMVQSNGKHLLELINDVLDYSKVESGKLKPKPVDILLDPVLKDLASVIRSQAMEKGHKLTYKPSDDALAISCDKRHFRQMMINLLTNAVKYTPEGGKIELYAERMPGNRVRIVVEDSGVGIAPEDRDKVFSPFERIDHSYSMNQLGTGLGMPLTKKLAEVNGGTVDFTSTPGEGSKFWLSFPAIEVSILDTVSEEDQEQVDVKGEGDLILLIEKDTEEREMVVRFMTHIGFNVMCSVTKGEVISALEEKSPDIVVFDNKIAEEFDENIVTLIRDHSKVSVPLVLISSRAFISDIKQYIREGVDRCLTKPVRLTELAKACREVIDEWRSGKSKISESVSGKNEKEEIQHISSHDSKDLAH